MKNKSDQIVVSPTDFSLKANHEAWFFRAIVLMVSIARVISKCIQAIEKISENTSDVFDRGLHGRLRQSATFDF